MTRNDYSAQQSNLETSGYTFKESSIYFLLTK